ncbi:MAG TPA: methyltransferase domain-containing protein [Pyrinomonadaceae bacterium]|nr:methyltransferase domain-containing protein [Pyrinomonadaceae bacterium]
MAELFDELNETNSRASSPRTGEGVVIDIGTGDGLFAYQSAKKNPRKFFIGIDPITRPLEKISEKVHRRSAKGGLPNVLFLQASLEDLPEELNGVADEVHVHFPWGSLLGALARGDETLLGYIRRICASDALLEVVIGLHPERDRSEIARLGVTELSTEYIGSVLTRAYRRAGFEITEAGERPPSDWVHLQTTWSKRLAQNGGRLLTYLIARAV